MFTKFKSIDSAYKTMRLIMGGVIVMFLFLLGFTIHKSFEQFDKSQGRMYVLIDGKAYEAKLSDRSENIPVEAEDHIKTFHEYFFTFDPDEKSIQGNISKAMYLADGSAKEQYNNLVESNYYVNVMSANISQRITIDSVNIDFNSEPYHFRCFGTQKITRAKSIVFRDLITEGVLRGIGRSKHNPHGFMIERWRTIQNKDISVESR